ncbi:MAG: S-layer homology domain-containing protein [Oscillospiraceae bacterium]|nr:S-layer homology domain-containing protein [Oscillospiraceae bacterium]
MKRSLLTFALALTLLSLLGHGAAAGSFPAVRSYTGQFSDVPRSTWYYENVAALYELGLTNGQGSASRFAPDQEMTVAEVLTIAARLRSLFEYGDSEAGAEKYAGGDWYQPYAAYLQSAGVTGTEFNGVYRQPATRAQTAHILANTLPQDQFSPMNQEIVAAGYANRCYIRDVSSDTPYENDILTLYSWGILSGMDRTGAFRPADSIPRSQVAAMVTRMIYPELRVRLEWESAYSRAGTDMADLVSSDGTFFHSPAPEDTEEIDADIRYMLSEGNRFITLQYPAGELSSTAINELLEAFLYGVRGYVEQTYNALKCSYSTRAGSVTFTFSSSLYPEDEIESYRTATMDCAVQVHDQMWAEGIITPAMSDYDKAKVYFTWICENCQYDFSSTETSMSHTGYSVFTEGLAVCDGYTAAYNLLLKLEGIPCSTVSRGNHIWTVAELDGVSYHIDATWGDQTGSVAYRFFGMTEADALARFD